MQENSYLKWLSTTETFWWNDSAVISEVEEALQNGATGVTTNPLLVARTLHGDPEYWKPYCQGVEGFSGEARIEEIIRRVTIHVAELLHPVYEKSGGAQGYVCAQVNPSLAGDREAMHAMARRLSAWAENIAVKLPGTSAGLDIMEECAAEGITTVGTVSFTLPQAVAIAMRQEQGIKRAEQAGKKIPAAFSVIMVGRLDDYLRDVAKDQRISIAEEDLICAGTAAIKRAYAIEKDKGYRSKLMPAGMRGGYHATALAGADMSMSLAPAIQKALQDEKGPYQEQIQKSVPDDTVKRLLNIPEFVRAYEPEGMAPDEFITYGASQKTLSQFIEAGWQRIKEW